MVKKKKKPIILKPKRPSKRGDIVSVGKPTRRKTTKEDLRRVESQRKTTKRTKKVKGRGVVEKTLDVISAPLSKPVKTFTEGLGAGGEAVAESRAKIEQGDGLEAAKVIGTTLASTAVAGAATLGAGALLGGGATAIKVSATTMNTIRNKLLAKQISSTIGQFGKGVIGKSVPFVSKTAPSALQYAVNPKTIGLTKKLLIGAGISLGVASIAKDILGTYPFASFGKEETLQSISFTMNSALKEGLIEEAQALLNASNEIVEATPTLIDSLPYANVQKEFTRYAEQQGKNNKVWQAIIDKKISELGQESDFAKERREGDEAAFERKREFGEEESERFEEIREKGEKRREEEAKAESERFASIEEENRQEKLREQELDSQYFRLIREKKFDEAEELLQSRIRRG